MTRLLLTQLQWGRRQESTDSVRSARMTRLLLTRFNGAADRSRRIGPRRSPRPQRPCGFNGAADRSRRIGQPGQAVAGADVAASMGPPTGVDG